MNSADDMKYVLFTHIDLDGAGCAISFCIHFRKFNHRVIHTSVNDLSLKISQLFSDHTILPSNTVLFFADISPDGEQLYDMISRGYIVHRFDHHPTAPMIEGLSAASVLDTSGIDCGTSLLDAYLRNDTLTSRFSPVSPKYLEFIDNIREWDTFLWVRTNNLQAKYLVSLFWLLGIDRFVKIYVDRWISASDKDNEPVIDPAHMLFVEAKIENANAVINATTPASVITINFRGYNTAVMFAGIGFNLSAGSNTFLTRYPEYDMMIYINMGNRTLSFRTVRADINVARIARQFGGGGHPKAAGCPVPYTAIIDIMDRLIPQ